MYLVDLLSDLCGGCWCLFCFLLLLCWVVFVVGVVFWFGLRFLFVFCLGCAVVSVVVLPRSFMLRIYLCIRGCDF